jgi:hypothetical protein
MVRMIALGVGIIVQAIDVVFSIFGVLIALAGAGIALALCVGIVGGLVIIFSFFLTLLG